MSTVRPEVTGKSTTHRLYIDRRAHKLIDDDLHPDATLTTRELASWLDVSTQFLEIARHKGNGPKFIKLSDNGKGHVRYRVSDVKAWLTERTRAATGDYVRRDEKKGKRAAGGK